MEKNCLKIRLSQEGLSLRLETEGRDFDLNKLHRQENYWPFLCLMILFNKNIVLVITKRLNI